MSQQDNKNKKQLTVKQVRGVSGQPEIVRKNLSALGLGRIGKQRTFNDGPAVRGMINRVQHMVEILN